MLSAAEFREGNGMLTKLWDVTKRFERRYYVEITFESVKRIVEFARVCKLLLFPTPTHCFVTFSSKRAIRANFH